MSEAPELLVLTALASEAETLLRRTRPEPLALEPPARLARARTASGKEALVGFTGLGAEAVRRLFATLEKSHVRPRRVVFGGVSGALRPELEPGDLVLVESAIEETSRETLRPDAPFVANLARAVERAGVTLRRGPALEVAAIRGEPGAKRDLAARFPDALVVAMEDAAAIRSAHGLGAEVALLRVVIDRLDERLPDLSPGLDAAGRPRPLRLAAHLALRPAAVLALPGIARSFGRARATLDRALAAALDLA